MSKTVLLFPGQGSQKVGMGADLAKEFSVAKETFEEADDALHLSISKLCFEGPIEDLTLTMNTQPAILTTSIAAFRVFQTECDPSFDLAMGHSLGEWTALVAAGALSLADAVRLVRRRGQAMQEAVAPGVGAMAAILGLDSDAVEAVCEGASSDSESCQPANYNGGGQVVVSGHKVAVERAMALAKEAGAKRAVALNVSAPFHSSLMKPAQTAVEESLSEIDVGELNVPVIANVDAKANQDASRVKSLLALQVTESVRWEQSVQHAVELGASRGIELGCGAVLRGLIRRIDRSLEVSGLGTSKDLAGLENKAA